MLARRIFILQNAQCQFIDGGTFRAPAFRLVEEGFLVDLFGICGVGQEADLHIVVFGPQKPGHPEKEAAGHVLLESTHGAGGIHHRQHNS
ncbi:hypothetical protein D3C73_1567440 [compost metagenome]